MRDLYTRLASLESQVASLEREAGFWSKHFGDFDIKEVVKLSQEGLEKNHATSNTDWTIIRDEIHGFDGVTHITLLFSTKNPMDTRQSPSAIDVVLKTQHNKESYHFGTEDLSNNQIASDILKYFIPKITQQMAKTASIRNVLAYRKLR